MSQLVTHLDSAQNIFFLRELEAIKKLSFDQLYPQLMMHSIVPFSREPAPFGAKKITFRRYNRVGNAKLIASYADDLPNVSLIGEEESTEVAEYGDAAVWSFFDIAAAALANKPLKSDLMLACRDILEERLDRVLAYGESVKGLTGFFNNAGIPTSSVATVGGLTTWVAKYAVDPNLIYNDVCDAYDSIITATNGIERATTMVLPDAQHRLMMRQRGNSVDSTVWDQIKRTIPNLEVIPCPRAKASNSNSVLSSDMFVMYTKSNAKMYYEEPLPFTPMAPQEKNMATVVNCLASSGGVIVPHPYSACYRTGI